jgi:hypothetical protein
MVFISYVHEDAPIRDFLSTNLRQAGIEVFTDIQLTPGTPAWSQALERALEAADAMVLVMTPSSKQSEWVRNECGYATVQAVPIVPLLAAGDERSSVPMELIRYQRIDMTGADAPGAMGTLVQRILSGPTSPAGPEGGTGLVLRTSGFGLVSKTPRMWRWEALVSARSDRVADRVAGASRMVLERMGAKRIRDAPIKKKDAALARVGGQFPSMLTGDVSLAAAVFPGPQPGVVGLVVQSVTTNLVLRQDDVRELCQRFALTMAGLVTEAGGRVM